ncbi:MAG: hypothetical protein Q8P90_06165, partial [bacterium]|nr:hypothetical protein [bacterium]
YCLDCWWKDDWDATTYGKDIDWDRSLLEQWDELRKEVPRLAVAVINSENCEYTNMTGDNKDCYLLFAAENNENCSYGKLVQDCKDCFDCNFVYNSELCYYCLNVRNCYRSIYLKDCQDSRECSFSVGLRGCSNVFLSSNLHNKEYYIENQLVPKEEYAKRVAELTKDYDAFQECIKKWKALDEGRVVKYANNIKSPESTGDYLQDCKRVNQCYDVTGGQDCSYVTDALEPRDTYDASFIYYKPELVYDSMSMLQCYNVQYSVFAFYCSDVQYGDQVHNSDNLLLSSCVRNKKNLILNKQYSKAEYKELREKVIEKMKADGEYGELPGMEHSLFRYNDTVANEYFPLAKADAIEKGLQWNDEAAERTTKDFKLTAAEKIFYKEMNLPEPKLHPEARHQERMGWRNPRKLWHRQCMCEQLDHGYKDRCSNEFETTYATERIEKVYCDSCYKKEFY